MKVNKFPIQRSDLPLHEDILKNDECTLHKIGLLNLTNASTVLAVNT